MRAPREWLVRRTGRLRMSHSAPDASSRVAAARQVVDVDASRLGIIDVMLAFWNAVVALSKQPEAVPDLVALQVHGFHELSGNLSIVDRLCGYLNSCSEVCDSFGSHITFSMNHPKASEHHRVAPVPTLVLKKRQSAAASGGDAPSDDAHDDWDDWEDDENSVLSKYAHLLGDHAADASASGLSSGRGEKELSPEHLLGPVPESEQEILQKTFEWVQAVIVDLGVCPFTSSSASRAGVPMGEVRYEIVTQSTPEEVFAAFWREIELMQKTDERALSTTLMITPNFFQYNAEGFDSFCATLTSALTVLNVQKDVQLVFFHPLYCFRDGGNRFGESNQRGATSEDASLTHDTVAANFARRSPFGMINLLRTPQVRAAQRVIPTGLVYKQNDDTMRSIGTSELTRMLRERDWSAVRERRPVDRRSNLVYEAAEKFRRSRNE
ncbi:hypothetical protein FVE85_1246 [Porphyridium purpureum]|uniref:Uncharacterized protein n=1 Tax=Porphyridium purpureum TaxID=35688 RepID=A0A5J4YHB2_PORPP|nr:hypothetical protein FVE85_1246 [Porphyridium purpureum]|eukprot:POR0523..scf251_18